MTRRLILAASRSGTKHTADLLCSLGLDFGHEQIRPDGAIGWQYAALNRYNEKQGDQHAVDWDIVLHQVRDPLLSIRSMASHGDHMMRFISAEVGYPMKDRLRLSMAYWLKWTQISMARATWSYRIEDLNNVSIWAEFLERMHIPHVDHPGTSTTTNTRPKRPKWALTWDDLAQCDVSLAGQIKVLAEDFGY